mgnify:FL=1
MVREENAEVKMVVFQDLFLCAPADRRLQVRESLVTTAAAPWTHAKDKEHLVHVRSPDEDVIAFERTAGDGIDAAGLVLWSRDNGYEVVNIVPLEASELGPIRYNRVLQDFLAKVAVPAASVAGFVVKPGPAAQGLGDWLSEDAAAALRRFSATANKSTGSSHPSDQRRWFSFLIAVHNKPGSLDTSRLIRWLCEVEGWSSDKAHELAIEYEFGLALLDEYDRVGR